MDLNSLFNKGKDLINKGANIISETAKEKKAGMDAFNLLISTSNHIEGLMPYEVKNNTPQEGREQIILAKCLTINVQNAKVINSLIPPAESIVEVKSNKEAKTQISYIFCVTDKCLWVLNDKEYKTYSFDEIRNFEIINKSIMTQGVKFNDNAYIFDGNYNDVNNFGMILKDSAARENATNVAKAYLCGVTPKEQYLNSALAGMTIGVDNRIVFHNGSAGSKAVDPKDISYIQLLMDNTIVLTRAKKDNQNIMSAPLDCRKMSIKVTLTNDIYTFDIMPQNVMGTIVKKEDSIYLKNYEFGKAILTRVEELTKEV